MIVHHLGLLIFLFPLVTVSLSLSGVTVTQTTVLPQRQGRLLCRLLLDGRVEQSIRLLEDSSWSGTVFHRVTVFGILYLQLGHKSTLMYNLNGAVMTLAFFCCRILIFPFMFYRYAVYANLAVCQVPFRLPYICTVSCTAIAAMQVCFLCWSTVATVVCSSTGSR